MSSSAMAERRIQMPAPGGNATAPEKHLNRFVHLVALLERAGNALGTLAFTWATVILLGGYPTVLRYEDDYWFATVIIFLEALRMFSRPNRPDYELFFRTRGAFRPLGLDGLILVGCLSNVLWCTQFYFWSNGIFGYPLVLFGIGSVLCSKVARSLVCNPLHRAISLWSPVVTILFQGPSVVQHNCDSNRFNLCSNSSTAKLTIYLVLLVVVLLLTISRMRFPCIIKLVDRAPRIKLAFWRRVILNFCMIAALVLLASSFHVPGALLFVFVTEVCTFVIASLGNLQLPTAAVRIVLALLRLIPQKYYEDNKDGGKTNLVPSLNLFYGMVLGQGILYVMACMLEVFSFILRRSLVRHTGFRGQLGVEHVNLYYAYAFEKCMGGAVLAPKKIGLVRFAVDCLESDSSKMQVRGLQMLYYFLKMELIRTKAISELTRSMKTVTLLFNMFCWTSEADRDIRIFAAKVTVELTDNLRVVHIPGAVQHVASLLETGHQAQIKNHLLYIDKEDGKQEFLIQQVARNGQNSPMFKWWKQMVVYCFIPVDEPLNMDEQTSHIMRWWKNVIKFCSVPEEEPVMDQDLLPVIGMLILDRLAGSDLENCIEISRATGLISKIIEFTSMRSNITNISETNMIMLKVSSLKVLRRLSSIKGKYGVTVRQNISEHPFLLTNLAGVLNDICNSQELRELATEILRNIAIDGNTSNEIGNIRVIISSLMHEFMRSSALSSTDSNQLLRMISGQALALLAMESVNNCLAMLVEPGYTFIKELTIMIHTGRHRCIAASLLWNISLHARHMLCNSDRKDLSYILREVLERIMDAEGAELEVLVGLSSQICNVIPEDFSQELEHGHIKERFVKRLVDALNANMIPSAYCPGIRRAIVEHTMCMMKCNSSYANCFKKCLMMEALLMVERTSSRADNYRLFLGDAGVMEHSIPLSTLVARTKELMGGGSLQGMSSGT